MVVLHYFMWFAVSSINFQLLGVINVIYISLRTNLKPLAYIMPTRSPLFFQNQVVFQVPFLQGWESALEE